MNFLSSIFEGIIRATAGFFITLGLVHGSVTTGVTSAVATSTNPPAYSQTQNQNIPTTSPQKNQAASDSKKAETASAGGNNSAPSAQAQQTITPIQQNVTLPTVNPNQPPVVPQGSGVATPVTASTPSDNFTFDGNTYNYSNLPAGMSVVPQGAGWTQVTTQYGTVWFNNQDFPLPASNVCNGVYYRSCPTGESLVCSDATAYCQTPAQEAAQSQAAAQAAAQSQEQALLNPLNNEISDLQTQSSACTAAMTSSSGIALGSAGVTSEAKAAQCENISSELTAFLDEKGVIQGGGVMTQTCSNNISTLEQQIYKLRQTAVGQEVGYLTSGSAPVGEGNAQRVAQVETQQEAPLLQQVQQNLYYCQN